MTFKDYYEMGTDFMPMDAPYLIYQFSRYNKRVVESGLPVIGLYVLDSETGEKIGIIYHEDMQKYFNGKLGHLTVHNYTRDDLAMYQEDAENMLDSMLIPTIRGLLNDINENDESSLSYTEQVMYTREIIDCMEDMVESVFKLRDKIYPKEEEN